MNSIEFSAEAFRSDRLTPSDGVSASAVPSHEHGWESVSRHVTSQGVVLYVRCVECGGLRMDLVPSEAVEPGTWGETVPQQRSRVVRGSARVRS